MSSAPATQKELGNTGSDEITLREPQYVFTVNESLTTNRHSEEDEFTD